MSAPGSGAAGVTLGAYITDTGPRVRIIAPKKWIDLSTDEALSFIAKLEETAAVAERLDQKPLYIHSAPGKKEMTCPSNS